MKTLRWTETVDFEAHIPDEVYEHFDGDEIDCRDWALDHLADNVAWAETIEGPNWEELDPEKAARQAGIKKRKAEIEEAKKPAPPEHIETHPDAAYGMDGGW